MNAAAFDADPRNTATCDEPPSRTAWRPFRVRCHAGHAALLALVLAISGPAFAPPAHAQETTVPPAALEARAEDGGSQLLPLTSETIRVRIDDAHATATYDHVFQNETKQTLEGNYRLTVGEGATATGFSYWNGESRVVGEIFERESAREVYEAMTGLRRDPGLLEQAGEGGFSFRVFPIAPGEAKRVQVTTARWLPVKNGAFEYRARLAAREPKIQIELRDARGASGIESPTHALAIEARDGASFVTVGSPKAGAGAATDELVLRYRPAESALTLRASAHRDVGNDAFVGVTFRTPPRAASAPARAAHDVTLVIDRSGSMSGTPMEAAKRAAEELVRRLDPSDAVNVIVFDDKVDALFDKPRVLDESVRRDVQSYIGKVQSRGGTNIGAALERALESQRIDQRPDLVLFMTDGQSDGPSAIRAAEKGDASTRVFTIGIGEGVDKALLARIASMKKGRFTFVPDARAVTTELPKVVSQLEPPVLTDLVLRAEGTTLEHVFPATLPDLFADDELRVFARAKSGGKVVLEGKENGAARTFVAELDGSAAKRPWVGRAWAQARVDELLSDQKGESDSDKAKKIDDEIVDLGLAFELVTPRTSFLAIPEAEMTKAAADATASMRERKQKILQAHKDAAALSRLNMPPGDPILRVKAPRNAKRVTASFPFGEALDLTWDDFTETWSTRFLVPKDVTDGTYEVPVVIVHDNGRVEATSVRYTIDSREPAFEIDVKPVTGGVAIRVTSDEPMLEARAAVVDEDGERVALTTAGKDTLSGVLPLRPGKHRVRVVVADQARNEQMKVIEIEVGR